MSRLGSPEVDDSVWAASQIVPSERVSAGTPMGSRDASVTGRLAGPSTSRSGTVAADTISRSATQSTSPGNPAKGRTGAAAAAVAARCACLP